MEPLNLQDCLSKVITLKKDGLSMEHKEVLLMRFVDGMTLPEIAEITSVPLGTIKSRLHHALAILRKNPKIREIRENNERSHDSHTLTY